VNRSRHGLIGLCPGNYCEPGSAAPDLFGVALFYRQPLAALRHRTLRGDFCYRQPPLRPRRTLARTAFREFSDALTEPGERRSEGFNPRTHNRADWVPLDVRYAFDNDQVLQGSEMSRRATFCLTHRSIFLD
jgi:hypothetical protein